MRPHPVATFQTGKVIAGTACLIAAISAWPMAAQAQVTGDLEVRLTIVDSCDVSGSGGGGALGTAVLDFGTATLLQNAIDADTTTSAGEVLQVLCNPDVDYTLTFDEGLHATDGTIQTRAMQLVGDTALVRYQLYTTAARTAVLDTITGVGTGTAQTINVYGRVPAQTAPPSGNYRDTVTITMSF